MFKIRAQNGREVTLPIAALGDLLGRNDRRMSHEVFPSVALISDRSQEHDTTAAIIRFHTRFIHIFADFIREEEHWPWASDI